MRTPSYTNRFEKDVDLAKRRGKDTDKLKNVIELIVSDQPLPPRLHDHPLVGKCAGRRECHIEPDWLLVYKLEPCAVVFERTGTHSDLF
jgi:mRNA interferase YafQ